MSTQKIPVYCYQCVAGPDLLNVIVEDGVATRVEPNCNFADIHPAAGRVCVKAYGLIQKTYNPHRVKKPMVRTNPQKGKDEDPQWKEVSWDEALDLVAKKLLAIRAKGLKDESGYPRLAVTFGSGGIAPAYTGAFPAFLSAWGGPIDMGIGSGQGVKCYHSEHLYGEFWHRAFTVQSDTPRTKYLLSFGNNNDASGGVLGVWRHAEARAGGMKRVQFEPHLAVTGAHAEWVPIKPKTDAAVLFAIIHAILHEHDWQKVCDVPFLRDMTNSPYLLAPNGLFLRDKESHKPLLWDANENRARPFDDAPAFDAALVGEFVADGVTVGADGEVCEYVSVGVKTSFQKLIEHVKEYTPEWAEEVSTVSAKTIRRVTKEFLAHANVGGTIEIEGRVFPYRPVAVLLGKTVTNGWGGYEAVWGRTMLATLVGSLEVPGGTIGTTVRLNRPGNDRLASAKPGPDGFMNQPLNPTDKANWAAKPKLRNAYQTLVPLANNSAWSAALGPAHLPWLFMKNPPDHWPRPTPPAMWITYRTNPAISHWDSDTVCEMMATFPFVVSLAYTPDETNWYADVLLPDAGDLESYQLYRIGGTKYIEQFWKHQGLALRQPVAEPYVDSRDMTDIGTELAKRTGLLKEYVEALNRGSAGAPLAGKEYDYALPTDRAPSREEIWDRVCKAATREMSAGKVEHDLAWFKEHGAFFVPFPEKEWFLHMAMEDKHIRYELPYQERITRSGAELGNRLHEQGIEWWDVQLQEYQPLPKWKDFPDIWARIAEQFDRKVDDFDLWLLTSRSMQYSWGSNVGIPVLADVAKNVTGHFGVMLNAATAKKLGIKDDDWVWIESPIKRVKGHAILREGVRPDCVVTLQQFGHWITPVAKDLDMPNMNALTPLHLALTDATGSGADVVRVKVYKANEK